MPFEFSYWKIIHTDNFGKDYPDEQFVENLPVMTERQAKYLADCINFIAGENHNRFFKAVPNTYKLQPGFEP